VSMLMACSALAQVPEVTPFVGYQGGGTITLNGLDTRLEQRPAYGVFVTFDRGPGRKLDLLVSHQQTRAARNDPFVEPLSSDVTVDYFQIGGRYMFTPEERTDPYIAMTVGGTRVGTDSGSGVFFSFAFGAGADVRLTRRTALRLDGRFHTTLIGSNAQLSCSGSGGSGTCAGFESGSSFTQLTASAGLVIHF
ncbi:MAG: outer membrane beta-barrel protein, partial [Thermoanaerobaculia bacterium]